MAWGPVGEWKRTETEITIEELAALMTKYLQEAGMVGVPEGAQGYTWREGNNHRRYSGVGFRAGKVKVEVRTGIMMS